MPHRDYSHQNLQNRSFKHRDLTGADFSYSDLRGCDFSGATLTGANFQSCSTGQSRRQLFTRIAVAFAGAGAFAGAFAVGFAVAGAFAVAVGFAVAFAAIAAFTNGRVGEGIALSLLSLLLFGFAIYSFLELIRTLRNATGTDFNQADLSNANFNHAVLSNTDFSSANTQFTNWTNASFSRCTLPQEFQQQEVLDLCTSRDGRQQTYADLNLNRLHLTDINLTHATLAHTNLNQANLQHAILDNANLSHAQALGTDFSAANLTGACIQNWGINSETKFTHVHCDYIYLEPNQQERKPASGSFQPGDFEKLVHQFTKTLDFLFRNGIQPEAFDIALRDLLEKYGSAELTFDSLQNFENGAQLLRINVADPDADKTPMHRQFTSVYTPLEKQLAAKQERINILEQQNSHLEGKLATYGEQLPAMWKFLFHQTEQFSRPALNAPNSHFSGGIMPEGNKVEIGSIGGDASGISGGDNSGVAGKNITGAAGGDVSGTLAIAMEQLEETKDPKALELAELLKQVKTAIEQPDSGLSEADQQKALKHLETLGKLATDQKNPDLLEKAGDALDALPTIIKRGNNLAEFAEKYLPTFTAGVKAIFASWGIPL